jgi:hypothetical protein
MMAKKAVLAGVQTAFKSSWKSNQNRFRAGTKLTQSVNTPTHVFAIHLVFQQKPSK